MKKVENVVRAVHRQPTQSNLGKDEEDFQKFESKIDEVLHLLKGMNNCDKKYQCPTNEQAKDIDPYKE